MAIEDDVLTRRDFIAGAGVLAAGALVPGAWGVAGARSLGEWLDDESGLPSYSYAGPLRFPDGPKQEGAPMLPDDPVFLLGNYRLTLFTHASGAFQLMTGERAWGRMNQGDGRWSGANQAVVEVNGEKHNLIGLDEPAAIAAEKRFGVGFARYDYSLPSALEVTRVISVKPSLTPGEGTSAFLVQVRVRNTGQKPATVSYKETVRARYQQLFARWDRDQYEVKWASEPERLEESSSLRVRFTAQAKRKMAFPPTGEASRLEQFPPALFVKSLEANTTSISTKDTAGNPWIGVQWDGILKPGEEHQFAFVIGYTRDGTASAIHSLSAHLEPASGLRDSLGSAFAGAWRRVIPAFEDEPDKVLRREMQWNVAALEAMATWREYYDETVIPQGTVYDYDWGLVASSRDLAQHALPLCHTNPALARCVVRYIMKRTLPDGEVKLNDEGFGWSPSGAQQTSDQQMFFFMLLAEYLRATGDMSVLRDEIEYYPRDCSGRGSGLKHVRQAFLFLRDRIGVGPHGIVRRWNSDWNDMFFFWPTTMPYNRMFEAGESHMNSAMAIVILGDLADAIDATHDAEAAELTAAMREYRTELYAAWMRDLGNRPFSRRAWTDWSTALGADEMWLEPQGFALLIPEFSAERKRRLFREVEERLLAGETMGARQIEKPVVQPGTPQGSRENGGFWYALNGPLILGVATFDRKEAASLLRRMTLANFAQSFPEYWTGRWSASDALDSSLLKTNGLSSNLIWCAHAHAWPLYCWLRLREAARKG